MLSSQTLSRCLFIVRGALPRCLSASVRFSTLSAKCINKQEVRHIKWQLAGKKNSSRVSRECSATNRSGQQPEPADVSEPEHSETCRWAPQTDLRHAAEYHFGGILRVSNRASSIRHRRFRLPDGLRCLSSGPGKQTNHSTLIWISG